jgi:transposase InsO family protein
VKKFYWKKIICRFGLPKCIVSDNGTQFASSTVINFCKHLGIQTKFVSVIHPQANRQVESANKVILNGIKKKLEVAKSLWAEQLHEVRIVFKLIPLFQKIIFKLNSLSQTILYERHLGQYKYMYSGLTTPPLILRPWKHHSLWSMARTPCYLWK